MRLTVPPESNNTLNVSRTGSGANSLRGLRERDMCVAVTK
jgi:hypothetical protein